ncbi:glycoside hydrolase [Phycomyces blakesleeanus]|uniref:Glycoside hydrolase n=2 Tax=Phycomyces blakesleeanus TaxID=4837 RepID=A0ABR3AMX0_PHYBL
MLYLALISLSIWAVSLCEASSKVIGYLPNWLYANYPVEKIPYEKYTHLNYAFAVENSPNFLPAFTDDWAIESALPKIIQLAHKANTKVLLSVGGWTGSQMFSPMVTTHEGRKKFIDWNLDFIKKYNTDGVDIDWEYPAKGAAACNKFTPGDSQHLLSLLKELRAALDQKFPKERKLISMAVHVEPFVGKNGPMKNVSAFVPYFDHINIMTYDINGAWASVTGPNAPFKAEPGRPEVYSYTSAIQAWKNAGVPAEKITAGLAFYGRSIKAKVDMSLHKSQYQPSEVGAPKGDSDDAWWSDPYCPKDGAGVSGIWKWSNIRSEGLLKSDLVSTGKGWTRYWDNVSQTPWLFNPSTKIYISYDDPRSLGVKVQHAVCEGLGGVMIWDIHQDNGELIRAVEKIHTLKPNNCPSKNRAPRPQEVSDYDPLAEYDIDALDPSYERFQ